MVMSVFTLPSLNVVFKIIKNRFEYPKRTTRRAVMGKYQLVFVHDRVGRLADAQEFEHLEFRRACFSDALRADAAAARDALLDYGNAIKDLAAANIFTGDMLLKNFGVSRHGRVICYDYDELALLTECNFRRLPQPTRAEEELAAEPWFHVGENDVFPEEFAAFLLPAGPLRDAFLAAHGDLLDVAFWRRMQERQRAGELVDFFPYSDERRLRRAS